MKNMILLLGFLFASVASNAAVISKLEFKFYDKCPDFLSTDDSCIDIDLYTPVATLTLEINTSVTDSDPEDGSALFADALLSATFYDVLDDKLYTTAGAFDLVTDGLNAYESALEIADPDNDIIGYYQASIFPDYTLFDSDGASVRLTGGQLIFYDTPSLGLSLVDFNEVRGLGMDGDTHIFIGDTAFVGNDGSVVSVSSVPEPAGVTLAMLGLALIGFRHRIARN